MASKRKLPWVDGSRDCPPPTGQPSHSAPSAPPSSVAYISAPNETTVAETTATTNISLAAGIASVPQMAKEEESPMTGALRAALEALKSKLDGLPPLQLVIGRLLVCIVRLQVGERGRQTFDELASGLAELAIQLQKQVVESKPRNVSHAIANVARVMGEQVKAIEEHQDGSIHHLNSESRDEAIVLKCYHQIAVLLRQLQGDISSSVWDAQREQQTDIRLRDLSPAHEARYNAALPTTIIKRVGCTKGTRVELLNDAKRWACDPEGARIHWLNGMAGTGKTTIAYTLCKMLHEDWQLGASFFCLRNWPNCRDVNRIIPTIAYQLSRYSNPYRQALCSILEDDPDIAKHDISTQFEQLVSKPLVKIAKAMPANVVVVVDALDECTDVGGTKNILNLLLRHAGNLPIKFFISSRPEPTLSNCITAPGGAMRSIMWLHDIEQSLVQVDIRTYLTEALESTGIEVTLDEINHLVDRAGSLFIFAATVVRYIFPDGGSVDHRERLRMVLELKPKQRSKSYDEIDELYATILSHAFHEKDFEPLELARRWKALYAVVCAREPLTVSALAEVLDLSNDRVARLALQPLQSVLHMSESTDTVSTFHASFPDFLLNKERAGRFHCDEAQQNAWLAQCCFRVMERSLRFNVCGLESSYQLDSEVPDLPNRINKAISTGLFYSCIYWGEHITSASFSPPLLVLLSSFLQNQFLFWLEVLNLKRRLGYGDGVLGKALAWLPTENSFADLHDIIHDGRNFVTTLAFNRVSLSTPHIYISALPFIPRQSHTRVGYWPKIRGLVSPDSVTLETRGAPILATWTVPRTVHSICIAQSSDGRLIASGSDCQPRYENMTFIAPGETIIWDASSGARVLGPFEDGTRICSLTFSPDDTHLASGLLNGTIRLREVSKGDLGAISLRGHTFAVNSVAFSPDGGCLASGSDDETIRLWDAHHGSPLGEPLRGHGGAVNSVAFSPSGKVLASGSSDGTIRVWDYSAGTTVQGLIGSHTDEVYSISYSFNGLRLVSSSADCTVRVWDMLAGTLLAGPFEGHTRAVRSVSFSPEGSRVVSGSDDRTIRVWETTSGRLLAGPFKGPQGSVNGSAHSALFSADGTRILSAFDNGAICIWEPRHGTADAMKLERYTEVIYAISLSPDGTRVASGSGDVIHVWDTRNGALVAGPFSSNAEIYSVSFSPDGQRIVCGCDDHTLHLWDASTGALFAGPIEGHTDSVRSVVFSPDGSQIASGADDGTIRLWNSRTGEPVAQPFRVHARAVRSISYSPDGSRVVSGSSLPHFSDDSLGDPLNWSTVQMWLASDGSLQWKSRAHIGQVDCVAFSPDGMRVVFGSNSRAILVLDARDGAVLRGPFTGHTGQVYSVAFSPDGTRIVSGSGDRMVWVWDAESGTMVAGPLQGHQTGVNSVVFSPDGARIISGAWDGTIRIWDVAAATLTSATLSENWDINNDGWLIDSKSQRLLWVPSDLRRGFGFLTPSNPIVINASCTARVDDTTLLGDRWCECYVASRDSVLS